MSMCFHFSKKQFSWTDMLDLQKHILTEAHVFVFSRLSDSRAAARLAAREVIWRVRRLCFGLPALSHMFSCEQVIRVLPAQYVGRCATEPCGCVIPVSNDVKHRVER